MASYTGRALRRREDPRLLTGQGRYVGDIEPAGCLHAAILRSPHAHARIRRIDTAAARALPGVAAVLTARDLGPYWRPLPNRFPHPALRYYPQYPLARAKVHYVGEPVAVVVATDRYLAEDALERIAVDYEPLPAVVDPEAALAPGAPVLHDDQGAPDNLAGRFSQGFGDLAAAFARAAVVVEREFVIRKCAGIPIECRGLVALVDELGRLVVWNATQTPHMIRDILASLLDRPPQDIRLVTPDVGGAFGVKEPFYPEDFLIPYLAWRLRRPVKWLEDRRENLLASIQERGQVHRAALAVDADGRILGLRDRFVADTGAFTPWGIVVPVITSSMLPGPYKLPAFQCDVDVAYTSTCPLAPYRGAGRPQAVFVTERLLDEAARALGLDRAEIRRRNFIQPHEFPYAVGLVGRDGKPLVYDSGNYPGCLDKLLELVGYADFAAEQRRARAAGRYLGLGLAFAVENNGMGPFEGARLRVEPSGHVVVATGACSQGQGHLTTLAQLAADELTVPLERVTIVAGDTDGIPYGTGTFASRTAVNAGNAIVLAAREVRARALALAARLLECDVADLVLADGAVSVRGAPDRRLTLGELASYAQSPFPGRPHPEGVPVGLEATHYFTPSAVTYSNGGHAAVVEVDPDSGAVRVLRYAMVHDCGNIINPLVLEGQLHGGFAGGIGNALFEEVVYDPDGQLLTASFLDYLIPTADQVPAVQLAHLCTPSPLNPLGVKGAGENAIIAVPACINNAVTDALGVAADETPLSPAKVHALLDAAPRSLEGAPGRLVEPPA
jgi:carbon-monoxide dehydrogenase large subunit